MQENPGLFEIRFNEDGKRYIRKFVTISYTIFVFVIFESAISIFWTVRLIMTSAALTDDTPGFTTTLYDKVYPYFSILSSVMALFSNFYYVRFPRVLLRRLELNDEAGANKAFNLLFKGALIFLFWLLFSTANMIWSLMTR